jgi:CRP/FNR family transcriptional regulator, cyclic AMP receptor protein
MNEMGESLTLTTGQLRRLKLFADLRDDDLDLLVGYLQAGRMSPQRILCKQGEAGDSAYLILQGEARVSYTSGGKETVLAKLEAGDYFGEVCLVEPGIRSADVTTTRECQLLKLTHPAFQEIMEKHPALAARLLAAIIRTTAARLRATNKRFADSMLMARAWGR